MIEQKQRAFLWYGRQAMQRGSTSINSEWIHNLCEVEHGRHLSDEPKQICLCLNLTIKKQYRLTILRYKDWLVKSASKKQKWKQSSKHNNWKIMMTFVH